MAKKGLREGLAKGGFGTITYDGPPAGYPKSSPLADIGLMGRQTARQYSQAGNMNKVSRRIGVAFPDPIPGSFYDGLVKHNDFAKKASQESRAERKAREKRQYEFKAWIWKNARDMAEKLNPAPLAKEGPELELGRMGRLIAVAACAYRFVAYQSASLRSVVPDYILPARSAPLSGHSAEHACQGIRRPSPVESRLPITRTTAGPSQKATRVKVLSPDGFQGKIDVQHMARNGKVAPGHIQAAERINQKA